MVKKIYILTFVIFVAWCGLFYLTRSSSNDLLRQAEPKEIEVRQSPPEEEKKSEQAEITENFATEKRDIEKEVPFVVQAPFANWQESVFQDGCEEASILMAMGWAGGQPEIYPKEAESGIKSIAEFENRTWGFNSNADLEDVQRIFREKFSFTNTEIRERIKVDDIINEVEKDKIILVPVFGRALGNPNFTKPGPISHMLVIKAYDDKTGEFITNDPGTKRGENYRYQKNILFDAIWQYPSSKDKSEIPVRFNKGMIIISK